MTVLEVILKELNRHPIHDLKVYDQKGKNPFLDTVVVMDFDNNRSMQAVASYVVEALDKNLLDHRNLEGGAESSWLLLDALDVVVHFFLEEERHKVNLDQLLETRRLSHE